MASSSTFMGGDLRVDLLMIIFGELSPEKALKTNFFLFSCFRTAIKSKNPERYQEIGCEVSNNTNIIHVSENET